YKEASKNQRQGEYIHLIAYYTFRRHSDTIHPNLLTRTKTQIIKQEEENAYKTHITCNKMQHRPKISNKYA
ncbi:hypothetical protein, partial [Bacteroides fragilis]|uniref:hypothetical protein n=2 Tax=Bacteroides fragilis TaxID=817 RepID=UPI0000F03791